jgi:hypothetical protein
MGEQALRFGVHDAAGHRAATWKLWTKLGVGKSDVYLTCRELRGTIKTSLHESGQWQVAFPQRTFEEDVEGAIPSLTDRFLERWQRPSEFEPGHTLALRIVTPWGGITTPVEEHSFKGVTWLPSAPESMATEIDIFVTKPTAHVPGWPGRLSMGASRIGSFALENGETVWAVYWFADSPDFSNLPQVPPQFFKGKSVKNLTDSKEGDLRVFLNGTAADGSRVICDCAVQITPNQKL